MDESTGYLIERIEALLGEGFSAEGDSLEAKVDSVRRELPDELREELQKLAKEYLKQGKTQTELLEFAFRCGRAHDKLESMAHSRLAANIAFLAPDGTSQVELEKDDLDAVAHFINLRDRILKTVADYTLKFLLVSFILVVIGLFFGLI